MLTGRNRLTANVAAPADLLHDLVLVRVGPLKCRRTVRMRSVDHDKVAGNPRRGRQGFANCITARLKDHGRVDRNKNGFVRSVIKDKHLRFERIVDAGRGLGTVAVTGKHCADRRCYVN
jgi:hypothetical protein